MTTVGILGVGRLAEFLVAGLKRVPASADESPLRVLLSPRNADRAEALSERYGLVIAGDNAELVAASDVVLLATRPEQAADAVAGLPWRDGQSLISLCAGLPRARLAAAAPAEITRAMPLSAAMIGASPTSFYPDREAARAVLAHFGPVIALASEAEFETATAAIAVYGWVHALIGEVSDWAADAGLEAATARDIVARTFGAAAGMVVAQPEESFPDLLAELATPGGITALGLTRLREAESFADWQQACAAVLAQLRSQPDEGPAD